MYQLLARFPFLINYSNFWVINDLVRARLEYEKKRLQRERSTKVVEEQRARAGRQARRAALEAVEKAFSSQS